MAVEEEFSEWMSMSEPVGEWMLWGGPEGHMEFDAENGRWRMVRPNSMADKIRRFKDVD